MESVKLQRLNYRDFKTSIYSAIVTLEWDYTLNQENVSNLASMTKKCKINSQITNRNYKSRFPIVIIQNCEKNLVTAPAPRSFRDRLGFLMILGGTDVN